MSEEDDHSFMLDYLTWMKGSSVKAETLHIYSFGYERNLPLPSIPLTPFFLRRHTFISGFKIVLQKITKYMHKINIAHDKIAIWTQYHILSQNNHNACLIILDFYTLLSVDFISNISPCTYYKGCKCGQNTAFYNSRMKVHARHILLMWPLDRKTPL